MSIRAVRNNNPGNIRVGQPWQGLMPRSQMTPEQAAETAFCVFESAAYGFRALLVILRNYEGILHGAGKPFTVENIVARWAPPSENNTGAYVAHVASLCGVAASAPQQASPAFLRALAKAIATHECGGWFFSEADLDAALKLIGL